VLTHLEGLVISRLFELQKMGLSGTGAVLTLCCSIWCLTNHSSGYKLHTHINKSLKTHCKAIQRALKKYNEAAALFGCPLLKWKDISTYNTLAKFELLQECWEDIHYQLWANTVNCEAALCALKLERAKEEHYHLNVEIAWLVDWINNKEAMLKTAITYLNESNSLLKVELKEMLVHCSQQDIIH
jgi:hypothetical protein